MEVVKTSVCQHTTDLLVSGVLAYYIDFTAHG